MIKVYGSYINTLKAKKAIDEILSKGYKEKQIKIVSKDQLKEDQKGVWEDIKNIYNTAIYDKNYWDVDSDEKKALKGYKENLEKDEIIILLEDDTNKFDEYFKNGAPDWDEREREFNEDLDQ